MSEMNDSDVQVITANMKQLSRLIDLPAILPGVLNKRIFNQTMIDNIMLIEDEFDRIECFLIDLTHRGPEAYDSFVEVLICANQMTAAAILKPVTFGTGDGARGLNAEEVINNIVSNTPPDAGRRPDEHSGESANGAVGHTVASIDTDECLLHVIRAKEEMKGDNTYRMTACPRGYCLIINNINYLNDCHPTRHGSAYEANRLAEVFGELHFEVVIEHDLTGAAMEASLRGYASRAQLLRHDAFVMIVLSHGNRNVVIASDGVCLNFEKILTQFNNENCPQLTNKPKLFFFNCCRGDNHDDGPKVPAVVDHKAVADAALSSIANKVPIMGDMMICYSTIDGYVSWRNEEFGSWFGSSLARALMKHSCNQELHAILTIISNMVNNKITADGAKQTMEYIYRGWKKMFYFNPGIIKP